MPFHYRLLWRDIIESAKQIPLTAKRLRFYVWFSLLFPLILISGWVSFLIDNIFYRRYMQQEIVKPLFIIGNFRSGSTLLQRLIGLDEQQFSGMKSWEIYTAPSITMRKLWRGLSTVDDLFGRPLKKALFGWEEKVLKTNPKHPVGIMEYEEDEGIFLFIWAGIIRWFFYPYPNNDENYHFFDTRVKPGRRNRLMKYYTRCIQRHVYYRKGLRYFSKNPTSTSKIRSILEWMPDARFIYLVRNPYDLVPSNFDLFSYVWNYFSDFPEKYPYPNRVLEMVKHFYEYPLEALQGLPKDQYHIVQFDEMVKDPVKTIEEIYNTLGYSFSAKFKEALVKEAKKSRKHKSNRKITIKNIGISSEYVRSYYARIIRRFSFTEKLHRGV